MSQAKLALLPDRGVIAVTGEDARAFLDNLISNDMGLLDQQDAVHAGLLTPQGKLLFEFFVVRRPDGYLLETAREKAADLVKRLAMYKLRARVALNDLSASRKVVAAWGGAPPSSELYVVYSDPRHADLGHRLVMAPEMVEKLAMALLDERHYHALRIALAVPEAGRDYPLGDTFPHEAGFDWLHGVSFTKGCFVGQEVVARMQNKTVVRKRVVRVSGPAPLASGAEVRVGEAVIGVIASADGNHALALLRLDRVAEAIDKGLAITAAGTALTVEPEALARYRASLAERASP